MTVLRNLLFLFPVGQRWKLVAILAAMLVTAVFEVAGVASIMPFMALLTNPDAIHNSALFSRLSGWLAGHDTMSLISMAGALTLVLLVLSNGSALVTTWLMLRFSYGQSHRTSCRLLQHYLKMPYEFFLQRNSTTLSKNILTEVQRVTVAVVIPFLQMISKTIIACCLVGLLLFIDPWMAIACSVGVGSIYTLIYIVVRRYLNKVGRSAIKAESDRFKTASEALSGIKDIKVSGRYAYFLERFEQASACYAANHSASSSIASLPKYILEIIAFGGIVLIALVMMHNGTHQDHVLSTLALYAFAGYRLMPAMQQIYSGIVQVRYHGHALQLIVNELQASTSPISNEGTTDPLPFSKQIECKHLHYHYPNGATVLQDISLTISSKTTIGIAGTSGAGKTTLVDILLGLLPPTSGTLRVDGIEVGTHNMRAWQSLFSYVPQHIYLTDDSIARNIAFGKTAVDQDQLEHAAKLAHLHDFILTLPDGYQTVVGERGVRLSGGQRQRIGIARALYSNPAILVLDEATSALDNATEGAVMDAINAMSGQLTLIIIAHRLTTLQACNVVYMMEKGQIISSGTYESLLTDSTPFRTLAKAASTHGA